MEGRCLRLEWYARESYAFPVARPEEPGGDKRTGCRVVLRARWQRRGGGDAISRWAWREHPHHTTCKVPLESLPCGTTFRNAFCGPRSPCKDNVGSMVLMIVLFHLDTRLLGQSSYFSPPTVLHVRQWRNETLGRAVRRARPHLVLIVGLLQRLCDSRQCSTLDFMVVLMVSAFRSQYMPSKL